MSENNNTTDGNQHVFETMSAVRDALNIAIHSDNNKATYEHTFRVIHDLDPDYYIKCIKEFPNKNLGEEAKRFIEQAQLASISKGKEITAVDLIQSEIDDLTQLLIDEKLKGENKKLTKSRLNSLQQIKLSLKPRYLTENAILNSDFLLLDKRGVFGEKLMAESKFIDYELSKTRIIRMRMFHPDKEEHISGADLVYEQYDMDLDMVRVLFLQYKTWDANGVIYKSQGSTFSQVKKMNDILCKEDMCKCKSNNIGLASFRFPHCSAFFRPTDKQQIKRKTIKSSGYLIPVCHSIKMLDNESKIEKKLISNETVNHTMFEKLFANNLIGSDWMPAEELEEFYDRMDILTPENSIRIYTREFINDQEKLDDELEHLGR